MTDSPPTLKSKNQDRATFDLSIVIVNWNTKDLLRNCLKSIYRETNGISYEVFVVDNASSDGSPEMVETKFPKVRRIKNERNLGFARANNQAFPLSRGRYILLLNPDTLILDKAINRMVCFMDSYPRVGLAGCRLSNPDSTLQPSCANFPNLLNLSLDYLLRLKIFPSAFSGKYLYRLWAHDEIREVDWVLGAFMIVRREVIQLTGGLDEDYFLCGEDMDWCYGIKEKGWPVLFSPQAQIIHRGRQRNPTGWKVDWSKMVYRANLLFYKKHYGIFSLMLYRVAHHAVSLPKLLLFKISQPLNKRARGNK